MLTLGISGIGHDASVALIENGRVVHAIAEERCSRVKDALVFPNQALDHVLKTSGTTLADFDSIGFYYDQALDLPWMLKSTYDAGLRQSAQALLLALYKHTGESMLHYGFRWQLRSFAELRGWRVPRVRYFPHHLTHAAMAYATSSFDRAAVVVVDGLGGRRCTSTYVATPSQCEDQGSIDLPHSLGLLYGAITTHLGFKWASDEWKVMGLAPYGELDPRFERFFDTVVRLLPDGGYSVDERYVRWHDRRGPRLLKEAEEFLGAPRHPDEELSDRHRAIARALQARTEAAVIHVLRGVHRRTRADDLCYVGGVALNCVANGRILTETPFRRIHVPYAPGDDGAALGAGLLANTSWPQSGTASSPYLGPDFDDAFIRRECERSLATFQQLDDPYRATAKLLARGDIVGWFQGRMEFGPRSLGHRSILADPRRAEMKDRINAAVKYRESFRPFAPAVLAEKASAYFHAPMPSPYMSFAVKVKTTNIPGVTHVDGTARVQTVEAAASPSFHRLLSAFEDETGVPVLLNTSFNVKGEPIVCTPADAMRCFYSTGLDHLVMGSYVLSKRPSPRAISA